MKAENKSLGSLTATHRQNQRRFKWRFKLWGSKKL